MYLLLHFLGPQNFSSNRSYATLSPPLLLSPGYVRSSGINYFTFTEPKHYMVNFVNHFFSGIWPTKGNFQGTAARWRQHQPLHTHSSLQSVALGMVKRYKPGFSRSEIIQKLQIACFYMKKTCQNVPTVLKCRTQSTPYLPFYYIFPPEFEISQFLG